MAGENIPGIPGACATRNVTYLARGPWYNSSMSYFKRRSRQIVFEVGRGWWLYSTHYRGNSTVCSKPFFRLTMEETLTLRIIDFLRGNHTQRVNNAESVSMSWRHHEQWRTILITLLFILMVYKPRFHGTSLLSSEYPQKAAHPCRCPR